MKTLIILMGTFFAFNSSAADFRELNDEQLLSAERRFEAAKLIEAVDYLRATAKDLDNATSDYYSHEFKVFEATGSFEETVRDFTKTLPADLAVSILKTSSTQMTRKDFYWAFATPADKWNRLTTSVLEAVYSSIKNQPGRENGITSTFQTQYAMFMASPACVGWLIGKSQRSKTLLVAAYNCYNE